MNNPCEDCCYKKPYVNREGCAAEDQGDCTKPIEWRGWQSGYQEGLAEASVKAREREIVEVVQDFDCLHPDIVLEKYGGELAETLEEEGLTMALEAWLQGKEA